jgi:hypothetical protein
MKPAEICWICEESGIPPDGAWFEGSERRAIHLACWLTWYRRWLESLGADRRD